MKIENILKHALDLRAALDPNNEHSRPEDLAGLNVVNQMIPNDPHTLTALIIAECKAAETANEPASAKKERKSKAVKAAEKLLRMSRKNPERKEWHYPQIHNGAQYITNDIIVVKLTAPLPLEEMPADVAGPFIVDKQFHRIIGAYTIPLDIPTAADLEDYVKTHKGTETYSLDCGVTVNARYLLTALEILNAKQVQAFVDAHNSGIYIQAPDGSEALVFGLRRVTPKETTPAQ